MTLLYLRLSVTDRCNLRCRYCRPGEAGRPTALRPALPDSDLVRIVEAIHGARPLAKVRITGGEPLMRPGLPALVADLAARLPGVSLHLTTNGSRLAPVVRALRDAGLAGVNISLDTLDARRFADLTGGGELDATLRGIAAAYEAGLASVKLNAVLMRTVNGDHLERLVRLAADRGCEMRFIELMPFGVAASIHEREYLSCAEALQRLRGGLCYVGPLGQQGTSSRHRFRVDGLSVTVGFITTVSHPFCHGCNRVRLDHAGRILGCLRRGSSVALAGLAQREVASALARALSVREADLRWAQRSMVAVGG